MRKPTFYEFFAGGGMARLGLGADWSCLFANDFDPVKAQAYARNWGGDDFFCGDVAKLQAQDLPGRADLAWASFPCQDLSLAGAGAGLQGARSGTFWAFSNLMRALKQEARAPKILVLENVTGLLTSHQTQDFAQICAALRALGYRYGALTMDAAHFLPQSRNRLFIVAVRMQADIPQGLIDPAPAHWASKALTRAVDALPKPTRARWMWWRLPPPPPRAKNLGQLAQARPEGVRWHSSAETANLRAMMSPVNAAKLIAAQREARASGRVIVGAGYRRTRHADNGDKVQRIEVRFDGVAGCLRTPAGGSSRQLIFWVEPKRLRTRLMSAREAARLMGLPDDYILPANYNDAYHLLGDGLAAPVVRFLADHILTPLALAGDAMNLAAE